MTSFASLAEDVMGSPEPERRRKPLLTPERMTTLVALAFCLGGFVQTVRYLETRLDQAERRLDQTEQLVRQVDTNLQVLNASLRAGKALQ